MKDINNTDLSRMETILEKFTGINNNLTEINVSVDKTHEELTKINCFCENRRGRKT